MTLKTLTAAFALLALPSLALAEGCSSHSTGMDQAMSCAEGSQFDPQTGTCVPVVTG